MLRRESTRTKMTHKSRICSDGSITFIWLLLFVSTLFSLMCASSVASSKNQRKLKHIHVIFAHKLHAPLEENTSYGIPNRLDYEFFLENAYEMANETKMEMFNLGKYLRQRYDNFLGEMFYPEVLKMRTSGYDLSIIAGLLVNAGIWPPAPSQKWKDDLDWQPIPIEYQPRETDTLFLGTLCPHFRAEEENMLNNDKSVISAIAVHEPLFKYVSRYSGETIENPSEMALLYSTLETIATAGSKNLPEWSEGIFPHGEMMNVTLLAYDLLSRSVSQKQLNGGTFLKNILDDSAKVLAWNNTAVVSSNYTNEMKISLYSGEERNLVGVMQALNLWWSPHLPENGASIIFELRYDESTAQNGFEIFYYTGAADNETIALTVPGCADFCSLTDFTRILAEVLPNEEARLCHAELLIKKETRSSSSAENHQRRQFCLSHFFIPFLSFLLSRNY